MDIKPFRPSFPLRNAHVQTVLASSKIRSWGKNPMIAAARERIFESSDGIRLLGYHSPQANHETGLVIMLHGWEGSVDSTYVMCTGRHLYRKGFSVLRLNFRDHGHTHHLNEGLFYAVLLDEVFEAVDQAARMVPGRPVFLVGFSLGGNFALRIGRRCSQHPIPGLKHIVGISPVLDPNDATDRIDRYPFVRRYFLRKWRRSLRLKQARYPDRYEFKDILQLNTIRAMTDLLLKRYSGYPSSETYFNDYAIAKDGLKDLCVPATIITAEDDPIISIKGFLQLETPSLTNLVIHAHGGHNGFVQGPLLKSWVDEEIGRIFKGYL